MAVSYNKARGKEFASQPKLAGGKHALMVVDSRKHVSKKEENDNLMIVLTLKKLMDPTDAASTKGPSVRKWLTLPIDNPEVEGHEAPRYAGRMWAEDATALNEDLSEMPSYDRDTKETTFKGEVLDDAKDVEAARIESINEAGEFAAELWGEDADNVDQLEGCVVYVEVGHEEGNDFPDLGRFNRECPDDWELTDDVMAEVEEDEEEGPAPKRSKKKAKKKAAKRKR